MTDQIESLQKEYLFPCVATYYQKPLTLVRGKGMVLTDSEGRDYLDFFGGILTVSVGHCNDTVNKAVIDQNQTLQHASTLYINEPQVPRPTGAWRHVRPALRRHSVPGTT